MAKMTSTYVIFHVLVLISCAIAILVKTEHHHSTSYVFTDVTSVSGWTPAGFSFLFGFLSVSWTMTDYDATAHIAEEYVVSSDSRLRRLLCAMELTVWYQDLATRNQSPLGDLARHALHLRRRFPLQHCPLLLHG